MVVADGMGGHEAGEVASRLAVDFILDGLASNGGEPRARLYDVIVQANAAIQKEAKARNTRGMGTTAIAVWCHGASVDVGLVGDTRAYWIRHGHVLWRTSDHTRVQSLLDLGVVTPQEAREHPEAGMLTRALGHPKMIDGKPLVPDVIAQPLELQPGDALVLSTDGLHDVITDEEIARAVAGNEPAPAAAALVRMALERGGHDNVTVAVVVGGGERAAPFDPARAADQTARGALYTPTAPPDVPAAAPPDRTAETERLPATSVSGPTVERSPPIPLVTLFEIPVGEDTVDLPASARRVEPRADAPGIDGTPRTPSPTWDPRWRPPGSPPRRERSNAERLGWALVLLSALGFAFVLFGFAILLVWTWWLR